VTTVKARMIDQSHFVILSPIPGGTKEFCVVLEEPMNDALKSLQKISGLLKDLDADSIRLFDETVQHNKFFMETEQ
jgi:hypothetical protein